MITTVAASTYAQSISFDNRDKTTAEKAAEQFHIKHSFGDRSHLPSLLKIVRDAVSDLPDSLWESLRYAPIMLGVDQSTEEANLTPVQSEALELVEAFVTNRKDLQLRFLYSVQAMDNYAIDPFKLPSHIQKIMQITEKCLNESKGINVLTNDNYIDVLNGLRNAYTAYRKTQSTETFKQMIQDHFEQSFINRIMC